MTKTGEIDVDREGLIYLQIVFLFFYAKWYISWWSVHALLSTENLNFMCESLSQCLNNFFIIGAVFATNSYIKFYSLSLHIWYFIKIILLILCCGNAFFSYSLSVATFSSFPVSWQWVWHLNWKDIKLMHLRDFTSTFCCSVA